MPTQHIYFSHEIYGKLREEANASQLINRLLKEHYEQEAIPSMSTTEIKLRLKELEIEKEAEEKKQALRMTPHE